MAMVSTVTNVAIDASIITTNCGFIMESTSSNTASLSSPEPVAGDQPRGDLSI